MTSFGVLAGRIYMNPIEALYMMSALITLGTQTPEFLDKDEYFPMNSVFEDPANFKALKDEVENVLEKTGGGDSIILLDIYMFPIYKTIFCPIFQIFP